MTAHSPDHAERAAIDVAAIIASLGERQRQTILALGRTPRRAIDFHGDTAAKLRLPGRNRPALTDRRMNAEHGRRTARYWLTDAGLAVRAALNDEGKGVGE